MTYARDERFTKQRDDFWLYSIWGNINTFRNVSQIVQVIHWLFPVLDLTILLIDSLFQTKINQLLLNNE
jgi:hypothetical protein